jgi:hypothetical protein
MKRFSFHCLRIHFVFLVSLAIIPSLSLILYTTLDQRQSAANEVQAEALHVARHVSSRQQRLIDGAWELLVALAHLWADQDYNSTVYSKFFEDFLGKYPQYINIGVVEGNGNTFVSAVPLKTPINIIEKTWFQHAKQTRGLAIGDYQIERITGKASIHIGYPAFDRTGQVSAVFFVELDLSWLNQFPAEAQPTEKMAFAVVDRKGEPLFVPSGPYQKGERFLPKKNLIRSMLNKAEGSTEGMGVDGVKRLYALASLDGLHGKAYVLLSIPKQTAFAQANIFLVRSLVLLGLVAATIYAAARLVVDASLFRRLNDPLDAPKRLTLGERPPQTDMPPVSEELAPPRSLLRPDG